MVGAAESDEASVPASLWAWQWQWAWLLQLRLQLPWPSALEYRPALYP